MMKYAFLDTSIVLRHILGEPHSYPGIEKFKKLFASELVRVEALRAIDRLRIRNAWPEEEVATRVRLLTAVGSVIHMIALQPPILHRASEPFSTIVGTLDALHISTALLTELQVGEPMLFLTHDRRQGLAAEVAGMETKGWKGPKENAS